MARLINGPNGGFIGRVGSVIGFQWMGGDYIKGFYNKSNKPATENQEECQSLFQQLQNVVTDCIYFIRISFKQDAILNRKHSYNRFMTHNLTEFYKDEVRLEKIDYSRVTFSAGTLCGIKDPEMVADDAGLHFTWTNNEKDKGARYDDQVMIVAYCPEQRQGFFIMSGARRPSGTESLEIPGYIKGKEIHAWISFIADDRQNVSMSTYMGSLVF